MCLLCIEFQKQRMTAREGWRAYGEMVSTMEPKHAQEVKEMLQKAEEDESESNTEAIEESGSDSDIHANDMQ